MKYVTDVIHAENSIFSKQGVDVFRTLGITVKFSAATDSAQNDFVKRYHRYVREQGKVYFQDK